jgi:hypothetical protein
MSLAFAMSFDPNFGVLVFFFFAKAKARARAFAEAKPQASRNNGSDLATT